MEARIDQIAYNIDKLEFTLFLSARGNQERIPISNELAKSFLYVPDGFDPHYIVDTTRSFIFYIFK